MWPTIKKRIPEASLHIFNGFGLWESCSAYNTTVTCEINELKTRIKDYKSLDVHHRGLIGQDELAKEMSESMLWLYPTNFTETFCISAVEAQCAGCRVVASNLAALKETVQYGQLIDGDATQGEYREKFIESVIHEFENFNTNSVSDQNRVISNRYDWRSTAKQWISDYLNTSSLPGYELLDKK
jgi:glycosyltransferase involved in cell wall biosynthesis